MKSTVIEIGEESFFEEVPVVILFNETAPEGLREVCIIHRFEEEPPENLLKKGSRIKFGTQEYTIEDIGHLANQSLHELGHISLYFNYGDGQDLLPGSAFLSPPTLPKIEVGDTIEFIT